MNRDVLNAMWFWVGVMLAAMMLYPWGAARAAFSTSTAGASEGTLGTDGTYWYIYGSLCNSSVQSYQSAGDLTSVGNSFGSDTCSAYQYGAGIFWWKFVANAPTGCPSGTALDSSTGQCTAPPPNPCASLNGTAAINPSSQYAMGYTSGPYDPGNTSTCIVDGNGCEMTPALGMWRQSPDTSGPAGTNNVVVIGYAVYTGQQASSSACSAPVTVTLTANTTTAPDVVPPNSGSAAPTSPTDCPPGTGYASINGQAQCLTAGTSIQSGSSSSTSGGTTTSSTSTTTINNDGSYTVTTTNNNGASTSVTSPAGSLSVGSSTPGAGTGQSNAPNLGPADPFAAPADAGTGADPGVTPYASSSLNADNAYLSEGGTCPFVDQSVTIFGTTTITFPISDICPYMQYLRWAMIALGAIAAIRIYALAPW